MMSDSCVRIERFSNGFTVEIKDPAIVKRNNMPYDKRQKAGFEYKDPWKSFVFKTPEEVTKFLAKNLKKAMVCTDDGDEYGTSFDTAVKETD